MSSADRFARLVASVAAIVVGFAAVAGAQGDVEFMSDDYTHVEGWAKLPSHIEWGNVISVDPDPDGEHVWAFHRAEPPILKFDPDGNLIQTFGDGMFVRPHGFHVSHDGYLWATDQSGRDGMGHQVFKFNRDGELLMTLGKAGVGAEEPDTFNGPTDVAVADNGDVFITDGHFNNRVVKYSQDGAFIKAWGRKGTAPGEFDLPHSIAIDSQGRVFVGDRSNARIQIFDQDGNFLEEWDQFGMVSGIYISDDDVVYVADYQQHEALLVGNARDGSITSRIEPVIAEGIMVDKHGSIFAGEVRGNMLRKFARKSGQTRSATSAGWTAPSTPWGDPDLQGIWDFRTITPMERPAELAGKPVLTAEEAASFEVRENRRLNRDLVDPETGGAIYPPASEGGVVPYNEFWYDRGTSLVEDRRTSLIVDPADGRIPPLTAEAAERAAARREYQRDHPADSWEDRSLGDRCMVGFNAGPPMVPSAYNNNVQLLQTPGYVVILNEMVHNARIVRLDGSPHGSIRQWVGDSRGYWEDTTLVVETRNFNAQPSFRGSSGSLSVVERFTRVGAGAIRYEFTVEDPETWTRPWTAVVPLRETPDPMFEYACHEGNYSMAGILGGARAEERAAAGAAR